MKKTSARNQQFFVRLSDIFMASKQTLLPCFIVLYYHVFVGFSIRIDSLLQGHGSDGDALPQCMQKLIPCQPYLQTPVSPPATCCLPLKQMVTDDATCLCDVFNNPVLLKSLNTTQDQALELPKACGTTVNISLCKNGTNVTPPASSATSPPPPSTSSSRSSKGSLTTNIGLLGCGVLSFFFPLFDVLP